MNATRSMLVRRAIAILAMLFGVMTIISGGKVLFGPDEARLAAGNYVPIVLWFNFLAGFVYVLCGWGLWNARSWSVKLAWGIAVATLAIFGILGILVATGTPYEPRTIAAMIIRSLFWLATALVAGRLLMRPAGQEKHA